MNFEWNLRTTIIASVIIVLLVGTNAGQYFWIWEPKQEELIAAYENDIADLEEAIYRIGPMVDVWTIKEEVDQTIFPGKSIELADLTTMKLPESLINQSFILDPKPIIGQYYRVGLTPGTPLSWDNVMKDPLDDTSREYDIVANIMPIGLKVGDYIDYRIVYPFGEDYIVLPHKRVEAIYDKGIKIKLNETEIHFYQAALIDYFLQSEMGAILYMTKYLEPGIQKPAIQYYAIPSNIQNIMDIDPNIITKINKNLNDTLRGIIDSDIANVPKDLGSRISSGRNEVSGKISQGNNQYNNEEKESREQERQSNQGLPDPATVIPPDPVDYTDDTTVDTIDDHSIPVETPDLYIGEGVVE